MRLLVLSGNWTPVIVHAFFFDQKMRLHIAGEKPHQIVHRSMVDLAPAKDRVHLSDTLKESQVLRVDLLKPGPVFFFPFNGHKRNAPQNPSTPQSGQA